MNPLRDAAIEYAQRGWRVVPLNERAKNPWINDWANAASTNPSIVQAWWTDRPNSNVGVALGEGSGLVGIDVDSDEGSRLLHSMSNGTMPETLEMVTGKGTRLLFAIPAGVQPKTTVLKDAQGDEALRFQGTGGQCVMPPSIHPGDPKKGIPPGRVYQWVEGRGPQDLQAAPMPGWLIAEMTKPPIGQRVQEAAAINSFAPGADYNRRASWHELLTAQGFTHVGGRGQVRYYSRPDGTPGKISVTVGHYRAADGTPALFCFSGSIGALEANKCYDLFGAYTRFRHGGDFKAASESLRQQGFGAPKQNQPAPTKAQQQQQSPQEQGKKAWEIPGKYAMKPGITAAELMAKTFEPVKFTVDNLLTDGLTLLGGRPKQGKSWKSLLLSWCVAGGHDLDGRASKKGEVLYLALEDTERRLHNRIKRLQNKVDWPVPAGLCLHTRWPRADQGGLFEIAKWLESRKSNARLVIIDTLAKFRKPAKGNSNSYAEDYEALGELKELLDLYSVSGIVVHHTRKMKAEDPFDEFSGTMAISGAADSLWVLDRTRGSDSAKLFVTGRDIGDLTIPMQFDKDSCRWTLEASIDGIEAEGRLGADPEKKLSKVEECKSWLLEFLKDYAYPANEITKAAEQKGFSFSVLKTAKNELGYKHGGPLRNKDYSNNRTNFWSGMGEPENWTHRPGSGPEATGSSGKKPRPRKDTGEGMDDGF